MPVLFAAAKSLMSIDTVVPGSALMNLLGGALYGHWRAWLLVNVLTAGGSTICYGLSWLFLPELVHAVPWLRHRVE